MTTPAVKGEMITDNSLAARRTAPDPGMVAAPQASDALAAVFRTAFAADRDLPDDFAEMLARLDRCEPGTH